MLETPYTPGPWRAERPRKRWRVRNMEGIFVMEDWGGLQHAEVRREADARLIAAAPQLYEALKVIVEHYGDPLQVATAAIRKAEGR